MFSRLLVRIKAQNKIDARIRFLFEHGSCDVWVKESIWYKGKQHRMDFDSAQEVEVAFESITKESASVLENARVNSSKPACTSFIDPLLVELLNRTKWTDEYTWYDPIVVNEKTGWLMAKSDAGPRSS